jgi:hypothetical protein
MSQGIEAVRKLTLMGYRFEVYGETIRARYEGPGDPDPAQVRPLLALVKEYKGRVINYLAQKPGAQERVLTCYECSHFQPAAGSPNRSQAWGYCRKRNRGRFGVATACEAVIDLSGRGAQGGGGQ